MAATVLAPLLDPTTAHAAKGPLAQGRFIALGAPHSADKKGRWLASFGG
jgi:hypothetical protein